VYQRFQHLGPHADRAVNNSYSSLTSLSQLNHNTLIPHANANWNAICEPASTITLGEDSMNRILMSLLVLAFAAASQANAGVIIGGSLNNGNLDRTHAVEIVPGFFLPKPDVWQNVGTRSITGPYEDEMSSEPWAGPAPTPVTTDGNLNPPPPDGCDGPDCAVFFKPFSGSFSGGPPNGAATGHLYQDNPGTAGVLYTLTGWAGAEANALAGVMFAIDFLDAGNVLIASSTLDLVAAGLFTPNGQPFNYKEYTVTGVAPANTATVRARASMIDGIPNPNGGGQAIVVDDFTLTDETGRTVSEPATLALVVLSMIGLAQIGRRRTE
jgi:hypothetical protein